MKLIGRLSVIFGASLLSHAALALPLASKLDASLPKVAPTAESIESGAIDFTSIVALDNCSGSLVRFTTSEDTDHAMVLTNGHCFEGGFINAGKFVADKASNRSFTLLKANATTLAKLKAERVMYATMTSTDITLYRLNTTYAALESQYGVKALTISPDRSVAGTKISIPSGYWKKIYTCTISDFVYQLREGQWTFADSIRYQQPGCETIGGTSGSPIVNVDTNEIIGINNTGNEDGAKCTLNNPCEVDQEGHTVVTKGASYGQQLFQIYGCLNDARAIDLSLDTCKLQK